jgi:Ca2+-binding RTX toxin-like protein
MSEERIYNGIISGKVLDTPQGQQQWILGDNFITITTSTPEIKTETFWRAEYSTKTIIKGRFLYNGGILDRSNSTVYEVGNFFAQANKDGSKKETGYGYRFAGGTSFPIQDPEKEGEVSFSYSSDGSNPWYTSKLRSFPVSSDRAVVEKSSFSEYASTEWADDPFGLLSKNIVESSPDSGGSSSQASSYTTAGEILTELAGEESLLTSVSLDPKEDTEKLFKTATWSNTVKINRMVQAAAGGATIEAKQTDEGGVGSVLRGSDNNDRLLGRAGWDIFDGRGGRDFIRGGNGRDVITGGLDADELWGDLGWNTYTSEKDGSADLIVIKSDQFLFNPLLGKAGNNTNGAKCDIIEGLDTTDRIRLLGVRSADISIQGNVNAKGVTGIGIYGAGYLEALYIGGDLTVDQITSMTSGDASPAAMANQISSYGWIDAPGTLIDEFISRNPAEELISRLGLSKSPNSTVSITPADASQLVMASTWSGSVRINHVVQAAVSGGEINAVQTFEGSVGSVLRGSEEDDILKGRAGWDIFDGRGGNDFIRGGNGRDIISGGDGSDELWGDLGWNTFMDERDGSEDLLVIKSDQILLNPILGKAGNNEDGSKCDIIEGLDSFDQIRILGVSTDEISFGEDVNAKGVTGIGIYGAGYLEALYIGGDLTVGQISAMTSGDASIEAMNNQVSSYGWIQNPGIL